MQESPKEGEKEVYILNIKNPLQLFRFSYDSGMKSLIRGDFTDAEEAFNNALTYLDQYNVFTAENVEAKVKAKKKEVSHLIDLIHERDNFNPLKEEVAEGAITFDDVVGLEDVKQSINRMIVYPYKYKDLYKKFNRKGGGGVLLYGLPGTGKTMVVKAIANEINAHLISVKTSDVLSKWFGEAEKNIRAIFEEARQYPSSIIYFDEFESLGASRGADSQSSNRVVCELLSEMDGFEAKDQDTTLVVMASTNKPWNIDSALLRSGRFNQKICVSLPDAAARAEIVKKQLATSPVDDSFSMETIATYTEGFNCADMVEFCNRLKDLAIERSIMSNSVSPITKDDIEKVHTTLKSSVKAEDVLKINKYNQLYAC